jgi:hypothetical protein
VLYHLCPDVNDPTGGIRSIYRYVDVLNELGHRAAVLHSQEPFRCTWFDNATEVRYGGEARVLPQDVLAVPEIYGPGISTLSPGVPKVILNQNAYLTFRGGYSFGGDEYPYLHPEVIASICVSEDSRRYLGYAFPGAAVYRVIHSIPGVFSYKATNKRLITFMPRKNPEEARQVLNVLHARGALAGWRVEPIDGMSESEVAGMLRKSAVFLSFGSPEGFGRPPVEAMKCGCYVVGYSGRGGDEYYLCEFSTRVEEGDIVGYAQAVESVLASGMDWLRDRGRLASDYVTER